MRDHYEMSAQSGVAMVVVKLAYFHPTRNEPHR
jgi:hypothetical protein